MHFHGKKKNPFAITLYSATMCMQVVLFCLTHFMYADILTGHIWLIHVQMKYRKKKRRHIWKVKEFS